jgi:two-component system cell cycle sensor histidine kinase PleC
VFEISTDITKQWDNMLVIENKILVIFLCVFILFFVVIMYNTHYAQKIIDKYIKINSRLEAAKVQAEVESSAKTDFLANISHELRTPLNAIIGFSEIILSENAGKLHNPVYKTYIQDINNSGHHLLSVINDVLDFSKAAADKLQVEYIEVDLNKIVSASLRLVKPRADKALVKLVQRVPQDHIILRADPKRLKQAILNLLSNAVKFTQADGQVTLSIEKDPVRRQVHVIVEDNGIGMSEHDVPKALSLFGQIDNKLSRKYEGTGLGLPLTKKLVELMNGRLDIYSEPNKGTKVTMIFNYSESITL